MKPNLNYTIVFTLLIAFGFNMTLMGQDNTISETKNDQGELCFVENQGQFEDNQILFKFSSKGLNLLISEFGVTFQLYKKNDETVDKSVNSDFLLQKEVFSIETVKLDLFNGKIKKENITPQGKLNTHINYYNQNFPDGISEVNEFGSLLIKDVYQNIDWKFYISNEGALKYDFVIREGGDYTDISLEYSSLSPISISEEGNLIIKTNIGEIIENKPVSFYENKVLETTFNIRSQKREFKESNTVYKTMVNFEVKSIENHGFLTSELVIDPQINWSTFFGGSGNDEFQELKSDSQGNLYGVGLTWSSDFPVQDTGVYFKGNIDGNRDVVISKFNNDGELIWSTYYGGASIDEGYSLDIDYNDNLYVTGVTVSNDFPLEDMGGYFQSFNGIMDAFVLKFDPNGNRLWATMLGGSAADVANSIATDVDGNIIVVGWTSSTDYPTIDIGGSSFFEGNYTMMQDIFITKFNNDGTMYWSTYFGAANEYATSVDTDSYNSIFITGATSSCSGNWTFQDGGGYFQNNHPGGQCDKTFILKFSDVSELQWSTYIAGSGFDIANSIIIDKNDDVILLGHTNSLDFPTMDNGTFYQPTNAGGMDLFISKFDNIGQMIWSTYYGGEGQDVTTTTDNLSISECNNIYLVNRTNSSNLPFQVPFDGGFYSHVMNGGDNDQFLSVFCPNGNLFWNTYLGGDGDEDKGAIDVDLFDNIFVSTTLNASSANASSYPIISSGVSYQENNLIGANDIYLMKIEQGEKDNELTKIDPTSCGSCDGTATVSVEGMCLPISYYWSNGESAIDSDLYSNSITGLCAGTYSVTVVSFCDSIVDSIDVVNVNGGPDITLIGTNITCFGLDNGAITVEATGGQPFTYEWGQSTSTDSIIENLSPGNYTVLVTDNSGCESFGEVVITQPDSMSINSIINDTDCGQENGSIEIIVNGGTLPYTFNWFEGIGDSSYIDDLGAGDYQLEIVDSNGCSQNFNFTVNALNLVTEISPDMIIIEQGESVTLASFVDPFSTNLTYEWFPPEGLSCSDCPNPVASPDQSTIYTLIVVSDDGCESETTVVVNVIESCQGVFLPSMFSPNGDGKNDHFCLLSNCVSEMELNIYNRWGELLFTSSSLNDCWDGVYRNQLVESGSYVYKLNAILSNGEEVFESGNITVVR